MHLRDGMPPMTAGPEAEPRMRCVKEQTAEASQCPIILFDAECILCSANAQFVLKHDKRARFRLASMQGTVGTELCLAHGLDPKNPSTILVVDGDIVRRDSDAVLSIYETLGFPWRAVTIFRVVPRFLRDPVYGWIARNRYRLFGRRETCWMAPPEYKERML